VRADVATEAPKRAVCADSVTETRTRPARVDSVTKAPKRAVPADASSRGPQKKWERPGARECGDARSRQRADVRYVGRVIDPNRILQRMTGELRALAGGSVEFTLKLDPSLGFAAAHNLPLKSIARTLVLNARDAMPDGGQLVVETANLEVAAGEPGEVPARAPDRYVTISFSDTGSELDPDTLSRLFDRAPDDGKQGRGSDRLALSTIYRVLQICGGDLSVNVGPGIGSTFTVFLPRAGARATAPRRAAAAQAPANASPAPSSHAAPPTLH